MLSDYYKQIFEHSKNWYKIYNISLNGIVLIISLLPSLLIDDGVILVFEFVDVCVILATSNSWHCVCIAANLLIVGDGLRILARRQHNDDVEK